MSARFMNKPRERQPATRVFVAKISSERSFPDIRYAMSKELMSKNIFLVLSILQHTDLTFFNTKKISSLLRHIFFRSYYEGVNRDT